MPDRLRRLLSSHEFLQQALNRHGCQMAPEHVTDLIEQRDRVFDELTSYHSEFKQVTLAQLKFLLGVLAEGAIDKRASARLRQRCLITAERLIGDNVNPSPTLARKAGAELTEESTRLLDKLSDRVAICDANYRYLYSNKANADFHGMRVGDFPGLSPRAVVGSRIFQNLTKPMVDRGLAGESFAISVGFRRPTGPSTIFAAQLDPVRDENGRVFAIVLVSRDVSRLPVKAESYWSLPKIARRGP